ncbi:hypothetical protein [Motilimonas sp. E26]|uniref:hypothetical protein n=1 Tax=Motilimonas sp. E26 TaxID=2865674 RepID=UPI001E56835C|nr:hypothetical protein [Motilimonas sp. E26]MCE0557699.1 hypothetical protein [Motilimonas sp. E26]
MAKKMLTPGQKRKRLIKLVIAVAALLAIAMGVYQQGQTLKQHQSFYLHHETAQGNITDLYLDVEEYHGRKGRIKTRDVYFVRYDFLVGDQLFFGELQIEPEQYTELAGKKQLEVWYQAGRPDINTTEFKLASEIAEETLGHRALNVALIVVPIAVLLNYILALIFAREPKGYLPEGFYTENSWLDVEDGYLVVYNSDHLSSLSIHKKHIDDVQHLYQQGGSWQQILTSAHGKLKEIPFDDIIRVRSDHYSDVFTVEYGAEQSATLEFLNPTVKAHALAQLERHLPQRLILNTHNFSRFRSARNSLLMLGILALLLFFVSNLWLTALVGLGLLWTVKRTISRLIDPTVRSLWMDLKTNRQNTQSASQ